MFLKLPSAVMGSKLSVGEFNQRMMLLERRDWAGVLEILDAAVKPVEAMIPATAADRHAAAAKRSRLSINDGDLSEAHGCLASATHSVGVVKGFHDHRQAARQGPTDVRTSRRTADCDWQFFSPQAMFKAAWHANQGSEPGSDGNSVTRMDLVTWTSRHACCGLRRQPMACHQEGTNPVV